MYNLYTMEYISPLDVLANAVNLMQPQPSPSTSLAPSTSDVHFDISDEMMYILLNITKCPMSNKYTNWMIFFNDQCHDWVAYNQSMTSELTTNRHCIESGYVVLDSKLKHPCTGDCLIFTCSYQCMSYFTVPC